MLSCFDVYGSQIASADSFYNKTTRQKNRLEELSLRGLLALRKLLASNGELAMQAGRH